MIMLMFKSIHGLVPNYYEQKSPIHENAHTRIASSIIVRLLMSYIGGLCVSDQTGLRRSLRIHFFLLIVMSILR